MFCEKCGAKIEDGAKFCEECGTPVASEEIVIETPEKEVPKNEFVAPVLDENEDETPVLNGDEYLYIEYDDYGHDKLRIYEKPVMKFNMEEY